MTKESPSPPPTVEGQIASLEELSDIVEAFPDGISHAFGYGSGVFSQSSDAGSRMCRPEVMPMMDLIFAVDDPLAWHRENMERYPEHYASLIRWTGPRMAHAIQTNGGGASVYFNPYVDAPTTNTSKPQRWCMGPIPQRQIKYGVVSTTDLIDDVSSWKYLYLAGRLHKPTVLIGQGHPEIMHHQQGNLMGALAASLLLVPGDNTNNNNNNSVVESLPNIFCRIAGLSYSGDFRMAVGAEDPEKIHKLVHSAGKYPLWKNLYQNAFHKLSQEGLIHITDDGDGTMEWDAHDPQTRKTLASYLPVCGKGGLCLSLEDIANPAFGSVILAKELSKIVAPAARGQGLKGILTAGVGKSLQYAASKFAKGGLLKR